MTQKIESEEIKTVYIDLSDGLGYYYSSSDLAPFICLANSLINFEDCVQQEIHKVLLEYHRSIPLDSIYRMFVLVKYYEDLAPVPIVLPVIAPVVVELPPVEAVEPVLEPAEEPEILVIGRAIIHRDFRYYEFVHPLPEARVIGQAG